MAPFFHNHRYDPQLKIDHVHFSTPKKSQDTSSEDGTDDDVPANDLQDLEHQELSGTDNDETKSLERSETDDDENEGVGDGNMGGNRI